MSEIYPGTTPDNFEVTNGTSEANYLVPLSLLEEGDGFALEVPNYMQLWGVPRSLGAEVSTFQLRQEEDWEPDWEEFERAVNPQTRLVYISNPNNPTGSVLSTGAMERIVRRRINRLEGFGRYMPIAVGFEAPLDIQNIVDRHQKNLDFMDDAVYVINLNPKST